MQTTHLMTAHKRYMDIMEKKREAIYTLNPETLNLTMGLASLGIILPD